MTSVYISAFSDDNPRYVSFMQAGGKRDDYHGYVDFIRAMKSAHGPGPVVDHPQFTAFIEKAVTEGRATQIGGRWLVGDL